MDNKDSHVESTQYMENWFSNYLNESLSQNIHTEGPPRFAEILDSDGRVTTKRLITEPQLNLLNLRVEKTQNGQVDHVYYVPQLSPRERKLKLLNFNVEETQNGQVNQDVTREENHENILLTNTSNEKDDDRDTEQELNLLNPRVEKTQNGQVDHVFFMPELTLQNLVPINPSNQNDYDRTLEPEQNLLNRIGALLLEEIPENIFWMNLSNQNDYDRNLEPKMNHNSIPENLEINLYGENFHPKKHLKSNKSSSQYKHTHGREGGKWVVNLIDSDKKVTEDRLTSNDVEKLTERKIVLEFGPDNQPEGGSGGLFGTWLGKLCRQYPFGLTYGDWRKANKQKKDDIWNEIQGKFHFDASNEEYKKYVMKSLGEKAKHHKNLLWKTRQETCRTLEEFLGSRPESIPEEEWEEFVHLHFTEENKELRERNKKSRSQYKTPHKLGKKSISRSCKEYLIETGERPSRKEIVALSHEKANTELVSEEARDKSVVIKKRKKIIGVESIRDIPTDSSSVPRNNPNDDRTILLTALHEANNKIKRLEESQAVYQHIVKTIANMPRIEVASMQSEAAAAGTKTAVPVACVGPIEVDLSFQSTVISRKSPPCSPNTKRTLEKQAISTISSNGFGVLGHISEEDPSVSIYL